MVDSRLNTIFIALLILFSANGLLAQDIHFSHYRALPLIHNPAFTGGHHDDYRVGFIYRNQWSSLGFPFRSSAISYNQKLKLLPQDLGVGLLVITDNSGPTELTQTKAMLSTGMHFKMGRSKLGFGVQGGIVFKSIGLDGITYPSQYDVGTGGFNSDFNTGETAVSDQLSFGDFNAGLLFQSNPKWGSMVLGVAIFHLNTPNETFVNTTNRLPMRYIFNSRAEIDLGEKTYLLAALYTQVHNEAQEILPSVGIGFKLKENEMKAEKLYFNTGFRDGFSRNGDSFLVTAGLDFKKLQTFITYDVTYSNLSEELRGQGAIEFGLILRGLNYEPASKILPCDRY
ncbi:MAG: PorP/SprF family type IX secretion system membrane protein [Flavobacteriales bacterium]